jgi:stalled ribosome rescue protein Dom34
MQESNNEMLQGVGEQGAPQISNEASLAVRLAEVEQELGKALEALKAVDALKGAQDATQAADMGPVDHLQVAKALLQQADKEKPSQNAKDAIQNINYAIAACKREV